MEGVGQESDFKESVGTFFVPESVRGGDSALSLSGVEVDSIDDRLVSLGVAGKIGCELVDWLGGPCSSVEGKGGVQEGEGDEEFLPDKGV